MPAKTPTKPAPRTSSRPNRTLTLWSTPKQRAMVARLRKRYPGRSFSSIVWDLVEALDTKAVTLNSVSASTTAMQPANSGASSVHRHGSSAGIGTGNIGSGEGA